MEGHAVEVQVGKVQAFVGAVIDMLARQETMQVHLTKANRPGLGIALGNRRYAAQVAHFRHGRQTANGHLDAGADIARVHHLGDVHRPQVAGDILADMPVAEIFVVIRRRVHLENLGAQVAHVDTPGDGIGAVHRIFKHDVGITGLELQFGQGLEEGARVDLLLANTRIRHHLVILLGHADITKRHAVHPLDVIGREQVHVLVALGQLKGDIGNRHPERERLDTDFSSAFSRLVSRKRRISGWWAFR